MRGALVLVIAGLAVVTTAPAARAAPPPNDARADAIRLTLGKTADGTVRDATVQDNEPECRNTDATVWYRFSPPKDGNLILQFDAGGDLDATVAVYRKTRSRLDLVGCRNSDDKGQATLELGKLDPDKEYFVQVAQQVGSDPGNFVLGVFVASPPASPPGQPLPNKVVKGTVDRLLNPSDAYNVRLDEGVTYRSSLSADGCLGLSLYRPKTRSFERDAPERTLRCGGYKLFTPDHSGRYFLVVTADRGRGEQAYRLRLAPARTDDTTPGRFIRNDARVRGHVNGRIDTVDLYRFDVTRPSTLTLRLSGGPELSLLRDDGHRIDSGPSIELKTKPGRYYAAVRGAGDYTLRRISRVTTRATTRFNGRAKTHAAPGAPVALTLNVSPGVSGPGVIVVERKDPLEGWQFLRRYHVHVAGGQARVAFTPPSVGRYRASSSFEGTRVASPSKTGYAKLRVSGPLAE
jgi:hypothetical protein